VKVTVLKETRPGETRVALVPAEVKALAGKGVEVVVESGAGAAAYYTDDAYREAGATVAPHRAAALEGADAVAKVRGPTPEEIPLFREGTLVIGFLAPLTDVDGTRAMAAAGLTALAMESVPRITRAQKMDALSSQASIAGYRAVLLGAARLPRYLPMLTTAAGTIRPSKVLVLGAGVAGLQAIATARRLGAVVEAFDVRPVVKEQVQSLGAKFLEPEETVAAEGTGGYAAALSEDQQARVEGLMARAVPEADLVITTAQIPGRPAPVLITPEVAERMRPGSVIVDLAAESGGNCPLTVADRETVHNGVTLLGPTNLPAGLPFHASQLYARNVRELLLHVVKEGALHLDFDDEITAGSCITHAGEVRSGPARTSPPPEAAHG